MLGLIREGRTRWRAGAPASRTHVERFAFGGVELELLADVDGPVTQTTPDARFFLPPAIAPTVAKVSCSVRVDRALEATSEPEPVNALRCTNVLGRTRLESQGLRAELAAVGGRRYAASARVAPGPAASAALVRAVCAAVLRLEGGLAVHAASVEISGRAAAYLGPSGAGKSTAVALTQGARCFAADHLALVPTATGWMAWSLPGGSPSGAPLSPEIVLPLAALLRVRHGRERPELEPLDGAAALFAVRRAVESDDWSVEAELARLAVVGRLVREVKVATIYTVRDHSIGELVGAWLGDEASAVAPGRGSA